MKKPKQKGSIMEAQELLSQLNQFNWGTDELHKSSSLTNRYLHTDGIQFLVENAGCHWLIDIVTSSYHILKDCGFQVWTINKKGDRATVICDDGDDNIIYQQEIEYTDFPLDTFSFYCELGSIDGSKPYFFIMLKNER